MHYQEHSSNYLFQLVFTLKGTLHQHRVTITMQVKVMRCKCIIITKAYEQSLSADCDFDLWPRDTFLERDTLTCHDIFVLRILKSHHTGQRYGPGIIPRTHTHLHKRHTHDKSKCYMPLVISSRRDKSLRTVGPSAHLSLYIFNTQG